MPTYSKKTWASQEVVTSTGLNQMSDNIELALRGLGSDKIYAKGKKNLVFSNEYFKLGTITFATDADDGDPGFSAAPVLLASLEHTGTNGSLGFYMTAITATTASIRVEGANTTPLVSETVKVHWVAIGA
jgi:hypothetical protein